MQSIFRLSMRAHARGAVRCSRRLLSVASSAEGPVKPPSSSNPSQTKPQMSRSDAWANADRIRRQLRERGLKKQPAQCTVELKGKLHVVSTHERVHPESRAMLVESKALTNNAIAAGYVPKTEWALRRSGTQQELCDVLSGHCERLTIALALKHAPADQPIRFVKNLRVCGDCHEFTKFISKQLNREFYIRDKNVWHHYKDGKCSCNDYY